MTQTFSVILNNQNYALQRVIGLFSRRRCPIQSMTLQRSDNQNVTNVEIIIISDERNSDQLERQLNKLIDVVQVVRLQHKHEEWNR